MKDLSNLMNKILEWLVSVLGGMIYNNYVKMCSTVVSMTTLLTDDLTQTPDTWNLGIFNIVSSISQNFILPIAVLVLTFVMVFELYQMVICSNNFRDVEVGMFYKWFFKMFLAIFVLDHAFEIVTSLFVVAADMTTSIINYINGTAINGITGSLVDFVNTTEFKDNFIKVFVDLGIANMGYVTLLFILSLINGLIGLIFVPLASLVVIIRYFYSYMYMAFAPVAFATFGNRDLSQIGQNYVKNILALAFQVVFIVLVIAIYYGSMQGLMYAVFGTTNNLTYDALQNAMVQNLILSVFVLIALFKTDNIARAIFTAQG